MTLKGTISFENFKPMIKAGERFDPPEGTKCSLLILEDNFHEKIFTMISDKVTKLHEKMHR